MTGIIVATAPFERTLVCLFAALGFPLGFLTMLAKVAAGPAAFSVGYAGLPDAFGANTVSAGFLSMLAKEVVFVGLFLLLFALLLLLLLFPFPFFGLFFVVKGTDTGLAAACFKFLYFLRFCIPLNLACILVAALFFLFLFALLLLIWILTFVVDTALFLLFGVVATAFLAFLACSRFF